MKILRNSRLKAASILLILMLLLSSCNNGSIDSYYRMSEKSTENTSDVSSEESTEPDTSPVQIDMAAGEILRIYTQAANKVKTELPGFKRVADKSLLDARAESGNSEVIKNIMNGIMGDILDDGSSVFESPMAIIPKGNSSGVRTYFPIFGESYGCGISGTEIISAAQCVKIGDIYELTIYFHDISNPEPASGEFGRIMSPVKKSAIEDAAAKHAATPGRDILSFESNYTNSYLKCRVDKNTGKMLSLEQNMTINISVKAELNIFGIVTTLYSGVGSIRYVLNFSDFAW